MGAFNGPEADIGKFDFEKDPDDYHETDLCPSCGYPYGRKESMGGGCTKYIHHGPFGAQYCEEW